MDYPALKKTVRLKPLTVKTIFKGSQSEANVSGMINEIFERYNFLIDELKPNFSDKEWLALAQVYNGGAFNKSFHEIIERMQWDVDQALQYDGNVLDLLGIKPNDRQAMIDFCERIRILTPSERLVVYHTVQQFWGNSQVATEEEDNLAD